jgi:glycosyltransferase involved in cell wall biosynthesis
MAGTSSPPKESTIFINGRFLQRPITGVERFARETIKSLDQLIPESNLGRRICIVAPQNTPDTLDLKNIEFMKIGTRQGHLWEQIDLPNHCQDSPLINLCNTAPIAKRNQIAVIHDAAVFAIPEAYDKKFTIAYKLLHKALAWRGIKILTVSRFSQSELSRYLKIPKDSIKTLPESGQHICRLEPDESILRKHSIGPRPYLLAVSSNHFAKNFSFVAKALASLHNPPFDVIIAGGSNSAVFSNQNQQLPAFMKRVGYVSDEALAALYKNAACFVFPSLYEGFGLPPLEAMAMGCPVISSNAASLPEICGDAALYFDPRDIDSFLNTLDQVMSYPEIRTRLRERSLINSASWTWQETGRQMIKQIQCITNDIP